MWSEVIRTFIKTIAHTSNIQTDFFSRYKITLYSSTGRKSTKTSRISDGKYHRDLKCRYFVNIGISKWRRYMNILAIKHILRIICYTSYNTQYIKEYEVM